MDDKRIFQLIDLDRTLFDTLHFVELISAEVNDIHAGLGTALSAQVEASYQKGETFFMLRYLRDQLGDADFEAMVERIVEREGVDALLLPGAKERLLLADTLTSERPSWGIMTYGDSIDQLMKLRLIGLEDAPVLLTQTPDKGTLIREWQNPDETFTLPIELGGAQVDILTLEDDKLRTFLNAPAAVVAIWIHANPKNEQTLTNEGYHIKVAKDLFESADYLRNLFL